MIAFAIGLCEILDDYAQLSLTGQDLMIFPSTVTSMYKSFHCRLENLSVKWVWGNETLRYAGIGKPKDIIDSLVKGIYKCEVSENVKIAAARRMNVKIKDKNRINAEMVELLGETLENLQEDLKRPKDITEGEFQVNDSSSSIEEAEIQLMKMCKDILKCLEKRIKIPNLISLAENAFNSTEV